LEPRSWKLTAPSLMLAMVATVFAWAVTPVVSARH
jgi:hypothetical protein